MPPTVSAILLAAGKSRRMGRSKPLLPLGDRPLVRHCLDTLLDGGVQEVLLVIDTCGDAVADAALNLPVTVVRNSTGENDVAESIRCALASLTEERQAVIVALVDHPLVSAETIAKLIKHQKRHPGKTLVPTCRGRRGHPILFPRSALEEIGRSPTLREIVEQQPGQVLPVPVEDPGILLDLDTPEEYRRAMRLMHEASAATSNRADIA